MRKLVLGIGGVILAANCFTFGSAPQQTDIITDVVEGAKSVPILSILQEQENPVTGIFLSPATSCRDTPPQLALFFALPMPVNRADHETLTMLPGIGPGLADNIIAYSFLSVSCSGRRYCHSI